jgi:NADH dehydrogenase
VYLFKLPSWGRRIQVGTDWAWLLLFPRDLAHIRIDTTERVTHAFFAPGDYIMRQGDAPANFYVIESGEVEVIRANGTAPDGEIIATLGAGSFFGEQALLNNQPRTASVRARTAVQVVVMGRNVFTTISNSLAPLRAMLTAAITRRSGTFWQERPQALAALRTFQLADFIEPPPQPLLPVTTTLREPTRAFAVSANDVFYIVSASDRLEGLVTLTDLLRAQGNSLKPETPVTEFMAARPASILATDTALIAASAFREHNYKSLPVVADRASLRVVGTIRARQLIAKLLKTLSAG